ncbi:hypothetical protein COO60DRAFT_1627658 [Scenedesmus sp. NREL 46B-D3]|nr:hypothetical protein COO60DRAFT_1627658 [Scenedesmus sp. NREL 46B-D3]
MCEPILPQQAVCAWPTGYTQQICAKALGKQQQKRKQQKQSNGSNSEHSTAGNTAPGVSKSCSKTRSKPPSKKKTKQQLNISNTRARLYASVLKRARRLAAAGDMLIFVHLPLGLNGKLRSHFQGLTKQQARAILGTLMDELK